MSSSLAATPPMCLGKCLHIKCMLISHSREFLSLSTFKCQKMVEKPLPTCEHSVHISCVSGPQRQGALMYERC